MSKSLQILLACIIAACLLLGYLVSLMLGPSGAGEASMPAGTDTGHTVRWPFPVASEYRQVYLEQGRQVFFAKGCWQCHRLGRETLPGEVNTAAEGPDLGFVGDRLSVDEIIESIVNPNAVIAGSVTQNSVDGKSKMPSAVENISTGDLMRLAAYLADRKAANTLSTPPNPEPDPNAPPPLPNDAGSGGQLPTGATVPATPPAPAGDSPASNPAPVAAPMPGPSPAPQPTPDSAQP